MWNTIIELMLIAIAVVIIVDISGFTDSWKSGLKYIITKGMLSDPNYSLKPFDCSLCLTFWVGLAYIIANGSFSLAGLTILLFISAMTPVINFAIITIREVIQYIIRKIYAKVQ